MPLSTGQTEHRAAATSRHPPSFASASGQGLWFTEKSPCLCLSSVCLSTACWCLGCPSAGVVVLLFQEQLIFRLQQLPDYTLNVSCPTCFTGGRGWVFLTFVRLETQLKAYVDGVLVGIKDVPVFDTSNDAFIRIGAHHVFPTGEPLVRLRSRQHCMQSCVQQALPRVLMRADGRRRSFPRR